MTESIKSIYLGNLTAKRGDDGFMYVKGLATDDTLDLCLLYTSDAADE